MDNSIIIQLLGMVMPIMVDSDYILVTIINDVHYLPQISLLYLFVVVYST